MIYQYDFYKFLMIVNKNVTLQRFLEKSGAKNGFALKMFTHLYNSIFSECHNVCEEFEQYYKIEYELFVHFLHRKYSMPREKAKEIENILTSNTDFILIDYDALSYGMNDTTDFLFGEKLNERVEQLLIEA